jgi:hypothetical protein
LRFLQNAKVVGIILVVLLCIGFANGELVASESLSLQESHLVRCLTHISHKYFPPGRSLVISSPSTYRDVQQELIAEIQRTAIWPVFVTVDGNITKLSKTDFIDRDGSYIIIIPDGNLRSLQTEIFGLALGLGNTLTRIWNSEARFVVAGANEFSISQQTDIFDLFSKFRIYNCIIVSRENYVMDREYSRPINVNDVDTGMKLAVYSWFPYQSSDRCTDVNNITLLDSWVISAQGYFTKNTDLFPQKISNNLNGCPMKAVVRDGHWGFTTQYVNVILSNGKVVKGYIKGLEYELLKVVLQQMNMTLFHVPTPAGFEMGEGSLTGNLVQGMFGKEIFIALGNVGTHFSVVSFLESTNTYYTMTIRWYVPCSVKYTRWNSIFRMLSVELWLVLIISILIVAILITLVGRYTCVSEWQGYKALASTLTNVWAVILGVRVSTKPRALSLRSLFIAWVCFSLAFGTVIQVSLTKFLIDSGYKTPIQNMDELFASGIKLAYQPEYNFIFENGDETEASNVQINRANCPSFELCVDWAKYQKNVSLFLIDIAAEKNFAAGNFVGENSEPLLCRLEDGVFFTTGLSMIMFYGDPLMKRVTEIIDRVVEAGFYNLWISFGINVNKLRSRKIGSFQPLDGYYRFNMYHLQPAFYLLLMGWSISVICFMVELLYNRVLSKRN